MSSLATASLSLFSPAISSRTGATILHGPHQVAQKSTTTVFALPSTSVLKVSSVTSTVFCPMCLLSVRCCGSVGSRSAGDGHLVGALAVAAAGHLGVDRTVGEPALGVDRGGAAGAGRGDGLPVGVVDQVTAGEHAGDRGVRAGRIDPHVALVVGLDLTADQLRARVVTDRDEHAG